MIWRFSLILFLLPACTLAKSNESESVKLIKACKELVSMYDRNGQENTLVSWFGSVSEGMQAGYCRGVIAEFRRNDTLRTAAGWSNYKSCNRSDWFSQAQMIANSSAESYEAYSVEHVLVSSCGH